ncbi:MAG TPA: YiiD C-terminal domain-containing protein [Gammaproteobacteria bacterium]
MDHKITALQAKLHEEIPLTRAMGLVVKSLTSDSVCLTAPLSNNINHKSTAFGGSLYSIAVLAGWSLIYSQLQNRNLQGHIVIQESDIKYIKPVTTDIEAVCNIESPELLERFIQTYLKKDMARIMLNTIIRQDGVECVRFRGKYVMHR